MLEKRNICLLISLKKRNKNLQKVNSLSKAAHGGSTISCPVTFTGTFSGRDNLLLNGYKKAR